ncbi:BTB/POZ domain-containing protein 9 [Geodia barretti]|nr:BTB/POZ domain-containing protein 9 [Geodia barretti]
MAGDLQKYLIQDLELLHDDRDSADLEFVAGGGRGKPERIRAHRLIVLCRCRRYRNKKQQWLAANSPLVTVKLERTEPETARRVVRYLYTGQVDCGSSPEPLIQTIVAALELGLPELKTYCLKTLAGGITADSACSTLISAHSALMAEEGEGEEEEEEGSVVREVEQCCMEYIETNTRAVFKSKGFLQLPKETLLSVIQSSKLTASEEDVWRGVLAWGQAKAGVQSSVKQWTENDRSKMKQVLNGVLEHVRLMEIGSEVFAQEVEPTGLLSMEMTLARYRHAAVHGKGLLSPSEKQSRPRSGCTGAFVDSELVAERTDFQMQMNEW